MAHFRFKPENVEAVRWTGAFLECDPASFPSWASDAFASNAMWQVADAVHVASPTTTLVAAPGDWIVKRADNSLQPFTPTAFAATFEPC